MGKKRKDKINQNVEDITNRLEAAETLFDVFKENKKYFKEEMSKLAQSKPGLFYKKYIEPLQPKEMQFDTKNSKVVVGFKFTEVESVNKKEKGSQDNEED